jgi:hypothetical protein
VPSLLANVVGCATIILFTDAVVGRLVGRGGAFYFSMDFHVLAWVTVTGLAAVIFMWGLRPDLLYSTGPGRPEGRPYFLFSATVVILYPLAACYTHPLRWFVAKDSFARVLFKLPPHDWPCFQIPQLAPLS